MPAGELTVFVVDDDASVRDSLALMLGLSGYKAALFADAESFAAAWQPGWAGCVVADLRLPGKSGIELQAEMLARGSRLPFVIITAHGDESVRPRLIRQGAVECLFKPFTEAALLGAINAALRAG